MLFDSVQLAQKRYYNGEKASSKWKQKLENYIEESR